MVEAGGGNAPRPPGGQPNDWTPRRFGLTYTEPNVIVKGGRERRRCFEFRDTIGPFLGIRWESRSGGLATIRGCGPSLGKNRVG